VIYATGIGKLTNPPKTGSGAPLSPLSTAVDTPSITVGGTAAQVLFAGLTPNLVGLIQFNIQLAANLPSGSLPMVIQSPGDSSAVVNLAVQGNLAGAPKLSLSTASLAFASVAIGQTKDISLLVSNTGSAVLNVSSASITGAGFSLTTPATFTVQPGGSQTVTVRFAPTSATAFSGTLSIESNDAGSPASVALSGTGVIAGVPKLSLSASTLAFGSVTVGQTKDMSVTISNTGTAVLNITSLATGGTAFAATSSPGFALQPGGSQAVTVRFAPTTAASFTGTLFIGSNDAVSASNVSLSGTGVTASSDVTLKVDGGVFDKVFGFANGQKAAAFVNRLTPSSYPATLKSVQIYFGNRANGLTAGTPITLIYGSNPSGSANFNATLNLAPAQVNQVGGFNTYAITTPLTIASGDFIIGVQVDNPVGIYPQDLDTLTPSQQRSYYAAGTLSFTQLDTISGAAGNLGIRAIVTLGSQ